MCSDISQKSDPEKQVRFNPVFRRPGLRFGTLFAIRGLLRETVYTVNPESCLNDNEKMHTFEVIIKDSIPGLKTDVNKLKKQKKTVSQRFTRIQMKYIIKTEGKTVFLPPWRLT